MCEVYLHVYDMSKKLASQISELLLGKYLEGIWHTGIVVYGVEWYFGNLGITNTPPHGTVLGKADKVLHLGRTNMSKDEFNKIVKELRQDLFKVGTYDLLHHNCNIFSNHISGMILGKGIPDYILELPGEVKNTPLGSKIAKLLETPTHDLNSLLKATIGPFSSNRNGPELVDHFARLFLTNSKKKKNDKESSNTN